MQPSRNIRSLLRRLVPPRIGAMRWVIFFLLVLTLTFSLAPIPPPATAVDSSSTSLSVSVEREIHVRNGGLQVVEDHVSAVNNGSTPTAIYDFYIPSEMADRLVQIYANDSSGRALLVAEDPLLSSSGLTRFVTQLPRSLLSGEGYRFSVYSVYWGSVEFHPSPTGRDTFTVQLAEWPTLPYDFGPINVTIQLPAETGGLRGYTKNATGAFYSLSRPVIRGFNASLKTVEFTVLPLPTFQIFEVLKAERAVMVDSFNRILSTDTYTVRNRGASINGPRASQTLSLNPQADTTDAILLNLVGEVQGVNDLLGVIPYTTNPSQGVLKVVPRLRLLHNQTYTFSVTYRVEGLLEESSLWGVYRLRAETPPTSRWALGSYTISITLPEGASEPLTEPNAGGVRREGVKASYIFSLRNATPLKGEGVVVEYVRPVWWMGFYPALWVGVLAAALTPLFLVRRRGAVKVVPALPVPTDLLTRFVQIYGERVSLFEELARVESEFREKKMVKREYRQRRRELESRLNILEGEGGSLKPRLKEARPEYSSSISEIEVAETELRAVEEATRTLEARFRGGAVSRGAYERLKRDYQKRLRDAEVKFEAVLTDLKRDLQ